jgi:hypothetical protein
METYFVSSSLGHKEKRKTMAELLSRSMGELLDTRKTGKLLTRQMHRTSSARGDLWRYAHKGCIMKDIIKLAE